MIFGYTVIHDGIVYKAGEDVPVEVKGATEEVAPTLIESEITEEKPKRKPRTKKSE